MSFYFLLAATFCAWTGATMMVAIGGIAFKIVKYYFLSPAGELGDTDGDDDQAVYYVSNEEARKSEHPIMFTLTCRSQCRLGTPGRPGWGPTWRSQLGRDFPRHDSPKACRPCGG